MTRSRRWDRLAWASLGFIAYTYAGYPLLLALRARASRRPPPRPPAEPFVSVIIAAYNEAASLGDTLASILASDYPGNRREVIVVSDGSTDDTDVVALGFELQGVRLVRQEQRRGQVPGFEAAAAVARGDVLLFADAGELFRKETMRRLAAPFSDPSVGAVSGAKITARTGSTVSGGDNLYTRYDRQLRALESRTGSSWVGCEGGIYAIRASLFRVDFPLSIAADNALCYRLYEKGYRHVFDPSAVVIERPSSNLRNEFGRKVRIIVTQIRGLVVFRRLLNPVRHPDFVWQNASHKIFRWSVPFALMSLLGATAASRSRWARALFGAQVAFYGLAAATPRLQRRRAVPRLLSVPAYFTTVNAAALLAWARLFRDYSVWQPPARDVAAASSPMNRRSHEPLARP
jgi:cellulose synthase/poly-beta-1,6-N-acetylglucosamine synthase-like glycosyltransferase